MLLLILCLAVLAPACASDITWKFRTGDDMAARNPAFDDSSWQTAALKHKWKCSGYAWFRASVEVPDTIGGEPTKDKPVALLWNAGDGGEIYVDGKIYTRYDNDHPACVVLTECAKPGDRAFVAVRVFMGPDDAEHETDLGQCEFKILDAKRVREPFVIKVDASRRLGELPRVFSGLSQGCCMADYEDATAAKLREIGIRWFRMDNVLTWVVKKDEKGATYYDWSDFDKRLDFMKKIGCEPIFCISYMPEPFDAVPDPNRHSYPKDWGAWEKLVYDAVKHAKERGTPVKYWEVWNESNAGWLIAPEGVGMLENYLHMYDVCARAVKKADPTALIGGPCNASGPWNEGSKEGPGVRGEEFMRGLMKHCEETGTPLDFITWHEYFHPWWVMKKQCDAVRAYLEDYPKVRKQVKGFFITEWNFAWWHDRAQDHELGAAWAAASAARGWLPGGAQPCFFFAKDGSPNFSGNWGMLLDGTNPKAVANVARMFNMMPSVRLDVQGEDDDLFALASTDPATGSVAVLVINFGDRYGIKRKVRLEIANLPKALRAGSFRQFLVDKEHSNIWHDRARAELETAAAGPIPQDAVFAIEMWNNAVALLILEPKR